MARNVTADRLVVMLQDATYESANPPTLCVHVGGEDGACVKVRKVEFYDDLHTGTCGVVLTTRPMPKARKMES